MPVEYEEEVGLDEIFGGMIGWEGEVGYEAEYAMYIEYDTAYAGTKPPFEPIHEWVQRNWGEISAEVIDLATHDDMTRQEEQEATAWLIVNSIAESGIDGVYFGSRAIEHGKNRAESVVAEYAGSDDPQAPQKIAEEVVEIMFNRSQQIIEQEAKDTGTLKDSGYYRITEGGGDSE